MEKITGAGHGTTDHQFGNAKGLAHQHLYVFTWCMFLVLWTTYAQAADASATNQQFRVLTFNIHHGEGLDKKVDLKRIADLITRERADLVGLQEVDKGVQRTQGRDFPAELAGLTGMTCIFSNNYHFQGGDYGNAILTRFAVKSWTNRHYAMSRAGEQRGLLQVVVEVGGRDVSFLNTHVDFRGDDSERLQNVRQLKEWLAAEPARPLLLCGDFNDTPGSRTCQTLAEFLKDAWVEAGSGDGFSIPAEKPRKRIDYIWHSRTGLVPVRLRVLQSEASDHLPVLGDFRLE